MPRLDCPSVSAEIVIVKPETLDRLEPQNLPQPRGQEAGLHSAGPHGLPDPYAAGASVIQTSSLSGP